MDRDSIERRDFPVGRRGYEQSSVDAHLRQVADEMERLRGKVAGPAARAPLSAGTSEQVRLILEAAEQSAAELRGDAGRRAGEHVTRVGEAADRMLERLDELQGELSSLLDGLRGSAERLAEGLAGLQEQVADVQPAPLAEPAPDPEPAPPPAPAPSERAAQAPRPAAEGDEAGARIIALNMALGGTSREETAAYLAEHFTLADPDALLDDVYAKAGR